LPAEGLNKGRRVCLAASDEPIYRHHSCTAVCERANREVYEAEAPFVWKVELPTPQCQWILIAFPSKSC